MARLAVTGQNVGKLIDCSEAVPVPKPPVGKATTFPAGTGPKLVQQSCAKPFPVMKTDRKFKIVKHTLHMCSLQLQLASPPPFPSASTGIRTSLTALRKPEDAAEGIYEKNGVFTSTHFPGLLMLYISVRTIH